MEFLPSDSSDDEESGLSHPRGLEDKTGCKESTTSASNASTTEEEMKRRPAKKARIAPSSNTIAARVRTFPHVRGRWPCSVYLPIDKDSNFKSLLSSAVEKNCTELMCMKNLKWELHGQNFHASLSKEFTLCQYQLSHFVKAIKKAVETRYSPYNMSLTDECVIHVNPTRTRSFVALRVGGGKQQTHSIIKALNDVMDNFALPRYYEDPSVHVSIASAVGDIFMLIAEDENLKRKLRCKTFNDAGKSDSQKTGNDVKSCGLYIVSKDDAMMELTVTVDHLIIKTGHILNKIYF